MAQTGIVTIGGKQYHTVAKRVDEYRKKHSLEDGWAILSEVISHTGDHCLIKCSLENPDGRTVATGHAFERTLNMRDDMVASMVEIAETSAVGRALAFAGYGGGGEIASADEMTRAETKKVSPKRLRVVVEALRDAIHREDGHAILEIRDEWEEEEWLFIWGTLQSWEKTGIRTFGTAARKELDAQVEPDISGAGEPPPNERSEKEQQREEARRGAEPHEDST